MKKFAPRTTSNSSTITFRLRARRISSASQREMRDDHKEFCRRRHGFAAGSERAQPAGGGRNDIRAFSLGREGAAELDPSPWQLPGPQIFVSAGGERRYSQGPQA